MSHTTSEPIVYVVDDDASVRRSLRWLLESVDLSVHDCATAVEFLEVYDEDRAGCVVLDVRMPGMSGLDLQEKIKSEAIELPIIIVTGHADVPMAIRAMKAGAFDFIEKPFNDQLLLERVQEAIAHDAQARQQTERYQELENRVQQLTPREREVMEAVVKGRSNKQIGKELGISLKTVEAHRARLMHKMRADTLSRLVAMVIEWDSSKGKP
jgi:RNA polymerase sigma factor (sigma-70 family)